MSNNVFILFLQKTKNKTEVEWHFSIVSVRGRYK